MIDLEKAKQMLNAPMKSSNQRDRIIDIPQKLYETSEYVKRINEILLIQILEINDLEEKISSLQSIIFDLQKGKKK